MKTPSADKINTSAFDEGAIFRSVRRDGESVDGGHFKQSGDPGSDGGGDQCAATLVAVGICNSKSVHMQEKQVSERALHLCYNWLI